MNIEKLKEIHLNTVQMIALGFLGIIFLGAVLLWLPFSNQQPIAFMDALFTSVTAVCVTGLVTVVPAAQFTAAGKVILLILIQIGGLGIVACTVAFFLALGKKITLKERIRIQQSYGLDTLTGMVQFIIRILKGTFFIEGIGAVLYAVYFIPRYGLGRGIAYGIFHSISAFCNAGIDILGDSSFIELSGSPLINFTTMGLIIMSGLGFTVWYDILRNTQETIQKNMPKKRLFTRLGLQSKIVLTMTAVLLAVGCIGFLLFEYRNPQTFGNLSFGRKLMAAGFQSVTTRTAGFAAVPQSKLTAGSRLLGCILMFVGGSPGGTAGGVKTTTVALILLTCRAVLKGYKDTECYGRKIEASIVRSAITIILVTFLFWLCGVMAVTVLEPGADFLNIMYEVTSAAATVGLTADLTPSLCRASQAVLMLLMFAGRIGPVTMALIFTGKAKVSRQLRNLPEKRVMIG